MAEGRRSADARQLQRELEKELASASQRHGQNVCLTASERAVLGLILDEIDRKSGLFEAYEVCQDPKVRVKLSAELRLIEASIARLLKSVSTEPAAPKSIRSVKAQRAARARWDRSA